MAKRPREDLDLEAMSPAFGYWAKDAAQLAIEKCNVLKVRPTAALAHGQPIEFVYKGASLVYLDLTRSFVEVAARVTIADGTAIGDVWVGPCNLVAQSMWGDVTVELGGCIVTQRTNGLYPFRAYLETVLGIGREVKDEFLQLEAWHADDAAKIGEVNPDAAENARNKGMRTRADLFRNGRVQHLLFRPHVDLFHQGLAIPPGVTFRMTLYPVADAFLLHTATPAAAQVAYQMRVTDAEFHLNTFTVTPALELAHHQVVGGGRPMRFKERTVEMLALNIPANQNEVNFEQVFNGKLPDRMFITFVAQTTKDGHYQQYPFNFATRDVSQIAVYENGLLSNQHLLTPDYRADTRNYSEVYMSLARALGVQWSNRPIGISYDDFVRGFAIYGFDLTRDGSAARAPNLVRRGNIRVQVNFRAAPTVALLMLVYAERPGEVQIEATGQAVRVV